MICIFTINKSKAKLFRYLNQMITRYFVIYILSISCLCWTLANHILLCICACLCRILCRHVHIDISSGWPLCQRHTFALMGFSLAHYFETKLLWKLWLYCTCNICGWINDFSVWEYRTEGHKLYRYVVVHTCQPLVFGQSC